MINEDIIQRLFETGISQVRVARELHMQQSNFNTLLHMDLTTGRRAGTRKLILAVIDRLATEDAAAAKALYGKGESSCNDDAQ